MIRSPKTPPVRPSLLAALLLCLAGPLGAQGTPIGFAETFALAADRERALAELVPGSPEHFYYSCLHAQHLGELGRVDGLLRAWRERHGDSDPRQDRVALRQTLLRASQDPQGSYRDLVRRLGLRFDQRPALGETNRDLPTRLDSNELTDEVWLRDALSRHPRSLRGLEDGALTRMAARDLTAGELRELLGRLHRPDVPGLARLVVRELGLNGSRGFGAFPIHGRLLLAQLEECLSLRPELLADSNFVRTYLVRLTPGADDDPRDPAVRLAHIERLERFAARLPAAFDSLRAHVLYHRLDLDLDLDQLDAERLLAYLRVARQAAYIDPVQREQPAVSLSENWMTGLAPIAADEPLVREYLGRLCERLDSFQRFVGVLRRDYVQRIFAEAKILSGAPDPERWFALLEDPRVVEELKRRVELRLPRGLARSFGPDEPVRLAIDVKNVDTLLVKVFEIDAAAFYIAQGAAPRLRELDATLDLDGLVAHEERAHRYEESPMRRVRRTFDFPELDEPGVYVVEWIGNGIASRAVIRKGTLRVTERVGAAGHVLRVVDEQGQPAVGASLLYAGREYVPDERGEIAIPFSTDPGLRHLVLRRGNLAVLEEFEHLAETYALEAPVHVEREALLAGERATLVVRPRLQVAGRPISLALLEGARLELRATDLDGVVAASTVRNLELRNGVEFVHEFNVPPRTQSFSVQLAGRVRSLSESKDVELAANVVLFPLNGIDATDELWTPLLARAEEGYWLEVRGKNGELGAGRVVQVTLQHRDYTTARTFQLQSDAQGRIGLGPLEHISRLEVGGIGERPAAWWLAAPTPGGRPRKLHALEGEAIRVPWDGADSFSLFELRGGQFAFERSERGASWGGSYLSLGDLAAGDYRLELHGIGRVYDLRVTRGQRAAGHAWGAVRRLELSRPLELTIREASVRGEELVVQLAGAGPDARVHVSALRYVPDVDGHRRLGLGRLRNLDWDALHAPENQYESGRRISDEYRYILERRFAQRFPGNMLARAGLLLNPWAIDEATSDTSAGEGAFGGRFGGRRSSRHGGGVGPSTRESDGMPGARPGFANLDFLAEPALFLANLRPDEQGFVRLPLERLGDRHLVQVVAVDGHTTVSRNVLRPAAAPKLRDRRLAMSLDPQTHLVEDRRIEFLDAGAASTFTDATNAGVEVYDDLGDVYRYFLTHGGAPELERFEFLVRWPSLSAEERLARYSEFAGHELHVFLRRKDPEFFERIVRPYLAHKAHKTFLDHWLLGADLNGYLEPWAFAELNTFERILLLRELEGGPARHVRELVELLPPETFALRTYFDRLLAGRALDSDRTQLGLLLEERARAEEEAKVALVQKAPAPGTPSTSAASRARRELGDAPMEGAVEEQAELDQALRDLGYVSDEVSDKDLERRQAQRPFFQDLADTRELAERHYWRVLRSAMDAGLVTPTPFWLDFAESAPGQAFVSSRFPLAAGNLPEMLLALALLDLPFVAEAHTSQASPEGVVFTAGSRLFLARRGMKPVEAAPDARPILVGQDFFRLDDPFVFERGRQRDKFVSGEFLVGVPYGCRVVVTNPTSTPVDVEVLLQIPEGALPVRRGFVTRGRSVTLPGYGSASIEYGFYFPAAGTFRHYPAHVGEDGALLAFATPAAIQVLAAPKELDRTSWEHLSQAAELEELLEHLERENLARVDLSRLAWRMRERGAYERILTLLRRHTTFDPTLWSFGLHHGDARTAREFLERRADLVGAAGPWLRSELLTIEPVERGIYEHLEYDPLVNARAHRFGQERRIYNESFARQYGRFLEVLAHKPALDDLDRMALVHYLLLQERIGEALEHFALIDPAGIEARLQYDYLAAYLAFYSPEPGAARAIAAQYAEHTVPRWRARFGAVLAQLDEAEGRGPAGASDPESRDERQGALAAATAVLELAVEARRVTLSYSNLGQAEIRYRPMNIELLFSTSPFLQAGSGAFAAVQPHRVDRVELPADRDTLVLDLPKEFASANVLVEVRGGGLVRTQAYYAHDLRVEAREAYGQLSVRRASDGAPLPATYVKVYARLSDGRIRFHKDGYTDLRGRFDYVSVSGLDAAPIQRFAVLVLSEESGALVRELDPPRR